ncbi:MAG: triple tyrosine motif-containing protein, partial [Myxococcota bacterium]
MSKGPDLWVAADDAVHHFAGGMWSAVPVSAYAIALGDDELWVVGPDGLSRVVGDQVTPIPGTAGASDVGVRRGAPWVVGRRGLMVTDADGGAPQWVAEGEWRESHLTFDPSDQVWVGERGGVELLGPAEALLEGHGPGVVRWPTQSGIRALTVDREGHLWLGTDGRGLQQVVPLPFRRHRFDDGGSPLSVRLLDVSGPRPLVAPGCEGLRAVPGGGELLPGRCVLALARGRRGLLIALGDDRGGTEVVTESGAPVTRVDAQVVAMAEHPDDGALWIGTTRGVWVLRGEALTRFPGLDETAAAITVARDGAVWIGQLSGLAVVRPSGVERIDRSRGMPRAQVRAITLDDDGTAWIGTYGGGMVRVADGQLTAFTRRDGLPEDVVSAIVDDGRGYLWLNGNRGVARVPRSDLARFREGDPSTVVRATLLPTGEGNGGAQPSAGRDRRGTMWFSTIDGAIEIDPEIRPNRIQPVAVVQQVSVDGQSFPTIGGWTSPAGQRDLSVSYTAAVLGQPSLVRFRYRLLGLQQDWREAGRQRRAEYSRLAPGRYTFEVQAANEDGLWSASERATFVLGARWSEQPLVRVVGAALLGALAIAAIIGVFVRFDRRRAARALELQEQVERSAAAEAHAKTQEAYYRSVFEGASDGLLVCGPDGVVRDANPAAERMFGSPERAVRGRSHEELLQLDASRREGLPPDGEIGVRADGRTFVARVSTVPLADGQALTSVVDLTPLLELQDRLAEAHRLEAVGRLAGGVAHDFNNLLTVARGSVLALRQQLGREGAENVDQIDYVITRGAQVTRQLLAFGRRQQLRGEPFDVAALVVRLQNMLGRLVEPPSTLTVTVATERAVVVADPTQMELTLVNLVINAADALGRGGRIDV